MNADLHSGGRLSARAARIRELAPWFHNLHLPDGSQITVCLGTASKIVDLYSVPLHHRRGTGRHGGLLGTRTTGALYPAIEPAELGVSLRQEGALASRG